MGYNKTKRIVGVIGSLVAILMGMISFIGGLIWTIKLFSDIGGEVFNYMTKETVAFLILTVSGLIMIIFAIISLKKPFVKDGKLCFGTGKAITSLIFAFISLIACIMLESSDYSFLIAFVVGYDTVFFVFELLLFIAVAVLFIVSFCLKPLKEGQTMEGAVGQAAVKKHVESADAPKYNTIKRAIEILAAVHTFIFGVFMIFDCFAYLPGNNVRTVEIIASLIFLIGVAVMVLGLLSVPKPKFIDGKYKKRLGVNISIIVLVSLVTIFSIVLNYIWLQKLYSNSSFVYGYGFDLSYFIFFALVMGYMLIAMNLPTVNAACRKTENNSCEDKDLKKNSEINLIEKIVKVAEKEDVKLTPVVKQEADVKTRQSVKPAVKKAIASKSKYHRE